MSGHRTELRGDWGSAIVDVAGPFVTLAVRAPLSASMGHVELRREEAEALVKGVSLAMAKLRADAAKPGR